jgi:membrane associated rhomboid family serine protease
MRTEGVQRTIPTRAISRSAGTPATRTFLVLALVFFGLSGFGRDFDNPVFQALVQWNAAIAVGEWWRLFTPVLLHASLMHIGFNMWALWVLGPQIERGVGTWPFVTLYLASAGVGGAFAFFLGNPNDLAVGASGAIFGLFGVWLNWAVRRRHTIQGQALLRNIVFLLLINAIIPFMIPGIAWEAHLGGLIAGFVIGETWSRIKGRNDERMRALVGLAVAALAVVSVLI